MSERGHGAWSLAFRIAAWYVLSAFAVVLAVVGLSYASLAHNLLLEDREAIQSKVQTLRTLKREHPGDVTAILQEVVWEAPTEDPSIYVRLVAPDGRTLLETPQMARTVPPMVFTGISDAGPQRAATRAWSDGTRAFLAATALDLGLHDGVRLQVALDRSSEVALLARYRARLAWILPSALLACLLLGFLIARSGVRPLERMAASAERIDSQSLDVRLETGQLPAEVARLAHAFNGMLDRLAQAFTRQARFSSDLAHELRTPLANMRTAAEVALGRDRSPEAYQEVLAGSIEDLDRLARIVDAMLFLARAETSAVPLHLERLDLARELETIRAYYEAAATEAGVRLSVAVSEGAEARAERMLLQRAIGNLVANALAHTPAGGEVKLAARADDRMATVEVVDTGSGIPPEHLPHVFERFYRADVARSGGPATSVGLGLSIVQSIAGLHGGSVRMDSLAGAGTRVIFEWPQGPQS